MTCLIRQVPSAVDRRNDREHYHEELAIDKNNGRTALITRLI